MRNRRRIRALARGFTLLELMIVVVVVSILALLAAPMLRTTRNDRLCYNFARTYQSIIHRAKVRAGARGGAHLIAMTSTAAVRGDIGLFEAIDTTPPAQGGPKPQSSCRLNGQWAGIPTFAPGGPSPAISPVVEGMSIGMTGDPAGATWSNVRSEIRIDGVAVGSAVVCYTPGGIVYVGTGADVAGAITNMQTQMPFSGVLEVRIRRTDAANVPIGLTRRIVIAGGSSPRIQSGQEAELPL